MSTSNWFAFTSNESSAYLKITTTELLDKFIDEISSNDAFAKALKGLDVSPLFIRTAVPDREEAESHECNAEGGNPCLFTDSQLTTVIEKCSNLEVLCIGYGPQIIEAGVLLNVSGPEAGYQTSNGPACLSEDVLKRVSELSKLEILNLYGCDNLSQDAVVLIGRGCPNLKQLCIDGEDDEEDDFEDILNEEEDQDAADKEAEEEIVEEEEERPWTVEDWKAFQNLEVLSADSVELAVVADLPKLTHVQIYPFAEPDVLKKFIESHADKLRYTNVTEEYTYTDPEDPETPIPHHKLPVEILKCSKLESFNMNVYDYAESHSEGFFRKVIESFPNLKHLELTDDSDVATTVASVTSKLTNLETLIWDSEEITDETVGAISKALPNLKNFLLAFGEEVSDNGVAAIAENLKSLEQLSLPTISPASVNVLKNQCPKLVEVGIIRSDSLTKEHVEDLKVRLPNLRGICITGDIKKEVIECLMAQVPEVQYHLEGLEDNGEEADEE
ncbi:RNI-like protein [Basidiobolus meristosporus CBS 931.73]|uniref:RNI-like protein n=1 Tax=Basidiobolus meristosporus CBS 931.73 TaxID=1314790 RepID=A0A1Y1Y777_9FUNG|nr:RNI-like protein [Basidiobolus meristosporus CBS 931.73]|eukprot:ORX93871.1 RNI-like protein [Basidiobolus meristosporus CBS 931.73]